jgi:hypothetical protein
MRRLALLIVVAASLFATGCGGAATTLAPQTSTGNTETPAERHDTRLGEAATKLTRMSPAERALRAMQALAHLKKENPSVEPSPTELAGMAAEELMEAEAHHRR